MGRPRDTPNAIRAQQQRDATTKLYEHYYGKKASDLNPTSKRASKCETQLLFQLKEEILGLELNKEGVYPSSGDADAEDDIETASLVVLIQRACVAASTALIHFDFPVTQRLILTCIHVAKVIAGDASQRRDVKLVADEFKPLIGKKGTIPNALSRQSKDQNMELNTTIKLVSSKSPIPEEQLTQPQAIQQIQSSIRQQPLSQQEQQQQTASIPQYKLPNYYNNQS
ncbi:MAG: hypothetical protein EZS28_012651 [Streblomastix strix]|uniref:Uncharacterized protein n=1 Tax=Streblomastix strix TaxID=222440 RepID=A0A5J4WA47_9EUKA|nr:MAG: hypothetical protein EZS28_012651 [Streblomastix strix]